MAGRKRTTPSYRKNRNIFIAIAVCPFVLLILLALFIVHSQIENVKNTYHLETDEVSPYTVFDKVKLLDAYTADDYRTLSDVAGQNASAFLDAGYLEEKNRELTEKYSFLAVIVDGEFTFFGENMYYEEISQELLEKEESLSDKEAEYYEGREERFLLKKISFDLPDGRHGDVCIATRLNVRIPHITILIVGLIVLPVFICVLVVIMMLWYKYYILILPVRELEKAAIRIRNGELDEPIQISASDEFATLCKEFDDMRVALKKSNEETRHSEVLTKEVVGNITHDLKTPLTAIKGYAEGIMDGVASTPDRMDRYVRTIYSKAEDMTVLVDELSYFTKIYQNEEKLSLKEVGVSRYFGKCIGDMALDFETRGIQLLYQCYIDEDKTVCLDEEKVKRVVANIIGNAVKYIDHNHGVILVRLREKRGNVLVMIRDNGKGIEKEEIPYIFERFYRTDSSRNSKTGGSGLGLAIAKKIIEEQGGKIWAESRIGKGTTISFTLPLSKETKEGNHNE